MAVHTKSKLIALGLIIFMAAVGLGISSLAFAGSGDPGSSSDPLVTRSYVDSLVQKKFEEYAGSVQPGGASLKWEIETLQAGESFIGSAGTEFILRGGTAVIVDPTGSGIPDITSGSNYTDGKQVPSNHLFSIPRSDGRGIKATKEAIIMYRG
jgi:hypothetical protein